MGFLQITSIINFVAYFVTSISIEDYNFGCIYGNLHAHSHTEGGVREEVETGREEVRGKEEEKRGYFWKLVSGVTYLTRQKFYVTILGT